MRGAGGSGTSSSGHTIENNESTELTQRNVLQFAGDLETSDDGTNEKTVVTPHELTSAEMAEIMSILPGTPTDLPVLFDERETEYVVGYYVDSNGLRKPVYRKTFVQTTLSNDTWNAVATLDATYELREIKGIIHNSTIDYIYPLGGSSYITDDIKIVTYCNQQTYELGVFMRRSTDSWDYAKITIIYTKTTDTPS